MYASYVRDISKAEGSNKGKERIEKLELELKNGSVQELSPEKNYEKEEDLIEDIAEFPFLKFSGKWIRTSEIVSVAVV